MAWETACGAAVCSPTRLFFFFFRYRETQRLRQEAYAADDFHLDGADLRRAEGSKRTGSGELGSEPPHKRKALRATAYGCAPLAVYDYGLSRVG